MEFVGIDIGTTSLACVVVNAATGETIRTAERSNTSAVQDDTVPGAALQDATRMMELVQDMLTEVGVEIDRVSEANCADVAAIGVTGQMHGVLYVDEQGAPLSPLATWQDGRGNSVASGGLSYVETLSRALRRPLRSGYGIVTHAYNTYNDLVPPRAKFLCTIPDFVAMKLAGRAEPVTDMTQTDAMGMLDAKRVPLDPKTLGSIGLENGMLPQVVSSIRRIGHTPKSGIPVICAIGDNQASFMGAVIDPYQEVLVNVGTGAQISVWSEQERAPEADYETRPYPGGGSLLVGASLGGGKTYGLLKRFFEQTCQMFGVSVPESEIYQKMNAAAEEALSRDIRRPLTVDACFFGTPNNPERTGSIMGIHEDNWMPSELTAAFLRGIVGEMKGIYDGFPDKVREGICRVTVSGNAMRRNPGLRRAASDAFHLPLRMASRAEEAAYGAALNAAVAVGMYENHASAMRDWGEKGGGTHG